MSIYYISIFKTHNNYTSIKYDYCNCKIEYMSDLITISGQVGTRHEELSKHFSQQIDATYVNQGIIYNALAGACNCPRLEFEEISESSANQMKLAIDACTEILITTYLNSTGKDNSTTHEKLNSAEPTGDEQFPSHLTLNTVNRAADALNTDIKRLIVNTDTAGWISGRDADFRVFCMAPRSTRISNLKEDAVIQPTTEHGLRQSIKQTERKKQQLCQDTYGFDITDLNIYDYIVNDSRWDVKSICKGMATMLDEYSSEHDDGSTATPGVFTTKPQFNPSVGSSLNN